MKKFSNCAACAVALLLFNLSSFSCFGQFTKLYDFTVDGISPQAGVLVSDSTYFYGMTFKGGTSNVGVIFKIKPDGTGFTKLFDFNSKDGYYATGSLYLYNGNLYGVASAGGANDKGVVFKIKKDGTGYKDLHDFEGAKGDQPVGDLTFDGTYFYGSTFKGGSKNYGVVYKIKPDGTGYDTLIDFDASRGLEAHAAPVLGGGYLYGMTYYGGANNKGVIYKIKPDGTGYTKLLDFVDSMGSHPRGGLLYDNGYLYGTTYQGGASSMGTVFKIKADGTGYKRLVDFNNTNGNSPLGALTTDGTYLYGMTYFGGKNGRGVFFKVKPDGTRYVDLYDFDHTNGEYPQSALYYDGTAFYGMVTQGGANSYGIIFKYECSPVTYSQTVTVCAGKSYKIGNNTYDSSGTYTDILTSYKGCDSTVTTKLIVLPENKFTQTLAICAGESVTVGTNTYTTSGTYTDVLTAANGCDSTVTTHLKVNPAPRASANSSGNVCLGEEIQFTDSSAIDSGSIISREWNFGDGDTSSLKNTKHTYAKAGSYTVRLRVHSMAGCVDSDQLAVVVYDLPNAGFTTLSPDSNGSVKFIPDDTTLASYRWEFSDSSSSMEKSPLKKFYPSGNYTVKLTVTSDHGCTAEMSKTIGVVNGIEPQAGDLSGFRVYPNPFSTATNISLVFSKSQQVSVEVLGIDGKLVITVYRGQVSANSEYNFVLDGSRIQPGMYFIKVSSEDHIAFRKIEMIR